MTNSPSTTMQDQETSAVLDRHLGAVAKDVDAIMADYTESSAIITHDRIIRGLADIRGFFLEFIAQLPPEFWSSFSLHSKIIHGEIGYITWSAEPFVKIATDTLLIRNDRILIQTFTSYT